MATTPEQAERILSLLADETCSTRKMMGEYLLYKQGVLIGGIYDGRLLFKPGPALAALLPGAPAVSPYPGAKAMILAEKPEALPLSEALKAAYADHKK